MFLHRDGFTGKRGLIRGQINRAKNPSVGGNFFAGQQDDDVSRHELAGWDVDLFAIANHRGAGLRHFAQRFNGALGPVFLNEPQEHGKQHDDGDGAGLDGVTE